MTKSIVCDTCDEVVEAAYEIARDCVSCEACVRSSMEHGHKHVHDSPEDCVLTVARIGGGPALTVRCGK